MLGTTARRDRSGCGEDRRLSQRMIFPRTTRRPMANPRLPTEISEYIVDFLSDDAGTLKQCCLVSKSWVPCARKHIFSGVYFDYPADLEAWKKAFLDPANTPAYHTRLLYVSCIEVITAADAEEGGWIRAFSNVVRLVMWNGARNFHLMTSADSHISLHRFHGLSITGSRSCLLSPSA